MFRRVRALLQDDSTPRGGIKEFVDPSYLNNKRPKIPGGSWPVSMLRQKSMGDLQQIWFLLVRERNMLLTMKDHYSRHAEELGAWPAPSRLPMVEESMENIKRILRERDNKANDAAVAVFKDRVTKRTYRYPPGPAEPVGSQDPTSKATVLLSRYVPEDRLRELFGRFDVMEHHKGIVSIRVQPTAEVMAEKEKAEESFTKWWWAQEDVEQYSRWSENSSFFDNAVEVEVAPGEYLDSSSSSKNSDDDNNNNDKNDNNQESSSSSPSSSSLEARNIPVPQPLAPSSKSKDMLERIKSEARTYAEKQQFQLSYFPNFTSSPPSSGGDRPVHADEILGPWEATIVYRTKDGAQYAKDLNITRIDGAEILDLTCGETTSTEPAQAYDVRYDEALNVEEAATSKEKNWPHAPAWSQDYDKILKKEPWRIVQHNWSNAVDYAEREALLTGKSIWESPIEVDPTLGEQVHIPPGAKKPVDDFVQEDKLHTGIV